MSDLKSVFELCLRDNQETLLLPIYNEEVPSPEGNTLGTIKNVKESPQGKFELDTHATISNTLSLNKVLGTDENDAPKKECLMYIFMRLHTKFCISYF